MTSTTKYIGVDDLREALEGIEHEACERIYIVADQERSRYILDRETPLCRAWEILQEFNFQSLESSGVGVVGYSKWYKQNESVYIDGVLKSSFNHSLPIIILVTLHT